MNTRVVAAEDRPSGSQVPVQKSSMLENVHERLKLLGEIVTAVVIVTTFISVIIGTMLIRLTPKTTTACEPSLSDVMRFPTLQPVCGGVAVIPTAPTGHFVRR